MALLFLTALAAAIELQAGSGCPSELAVKASLQMLGDPQSDRDGRVYWTIDDGRLLVSVSTSSTSTSAVTRSLPLGPCAELADQVALIVERATSPLGFALPLPEREASEGSTQLSVLAGPLVLLGTHPALGISIGAEIYPSAFGVLVAIEGTLPSTFSVQSRALTSLRLARFSAAAGVGIRTYLSETLSAGGVLYGFIELISGGPTTVLDDRRQVGDLRAGLRGGPFLRLELRPMTLGVEVCLRAAPSRSYRAIPATELVVLPSVEGQILVTIGMILF